MQNSINQKNNSNQKNSRKNKLKYIPLALAISLGMISCDKDDEFAPIIQLKQSSISLENGESITPSDYFIVSDDQDPNPTILIDINDKAISYDQAYTFQQSGNFDMNCEARDISGNVSSAKIKITVGVGLPQLSGLENLQQNINPKIDQEINLLAGIQATDTKDGDITDNIQVYIKNINQQREKIENPTNYIINYPGTIELKYQIQDTDNNNIEQIKTLDIPPKTWENITIPQMNIKPTDPGFSPNTVIYNPNWFEYLETLKVYEARAMSKTMIKNGLGTMTAKEYLDKVNQRQVISVGGGPEIDDETQGQYDTKNVIGGNNHDRIVANIIFGKENNGTSATGVIGPIIQQPGINKPIWMNSNNFMSPWEGYKNIINSELPNKKIIIFAVNDGGYTSDFSEIDNTPDTKAIKYLVNSGKCIIFAGSSNITGNTETNINSYKLWKEGYEDGDPQGVRGMLTSITGVQSVGGCQSGFQVDIKKEYRQQGASSSRLVIGDPKDIWYTPGYHAFGEEGKIYSSISGASSQATPSFTGLAYLVMLTNPSMTTDELLETMRKYAKEVPVNYHIDPSQSYISKTVDPSKAFAELIVTAPTQISLSSSDLIPLTRNGYKFSIPHGDGVVKSDGTPLSQSEIDNISTRGSLTQEHFFINPDELKKLGYKEGDTLTISVSVCSDSENSYEQIWEKTYDIKLLP